MGLYFDRTFFKFIGGFIALLLVSFVVFFVAQYYSEGSSQIPMASTSNGNTGAPSMSSSASSEAPNSLPDQFQR
jgi:hypothetical protein